MEFFHKAMPTKAGKEKDQFWKGEIEGKSGGILLDENEEGGFSL